MKSKSKSKRADAQKKQPEKKGMSIIPDKKIADHAKSKRKR